MGSSQPPVALPEESRLYTFIDAERRHALYFLDGQRLIHDLALIHAVHGAGFAYFRDVVLSILKHGEQYGFYLDSTDPPFLIKMETGHHGGTRCVLLPEGFAQFPPALRGHVRLQKLSPHRAPYDSVLAADGLPLREMVNRLLRDSYQVKCAVLLAERSDQSVLLHLLPPLEGKEDYEFSPEAVRERRESLRGGLERIFERALSRREEVLEAFSGIGFRHLADRQVALQCSCTKERFVQGLRSLARNDREYLFDPGRDRLEVTCEYCKTGYVITRQDVARAAFPLH